MSRMPVNRAFTVISVDYLQSNRGYTVACLLLMCIVTSVLCLGKVVQYMYVCVCVCATE